MSMGTSWFWQALGSYSLKAPDSIHVFPKGWRGAQDNNTSCTMAWAHAKPIAGDLVTLRCLVVVDIDLHVFFMNHDSCQHSYHTSLWLSEDQSHHLPSLMFKDLSQPLCCRGLEVVARKVPVLEAWVLLDTEHPRCMRARARKCVCVCVHSCSMKIEHVSSTTKRRAASNSARQPTISANAGWHVCCHQKTTLGTLGA